MRTTPRHVRIGGQAAGGTTTSCGLAGGRARRLGNCCPTAVFAGVLAWWLALGGCNRDSSPTARARADAAPESVTSPVPAHPRVLLVHSYHTGYSWVDSITQGVRRAFSAAPVDLQILYMDTKRNPTEDWKRQAGQAAKTVVTEWKPNVVIAADDNAQQYFARDYVTQDRPQFVFCGVNAEPEEYGYPAPNVTGVLERPHFKATLDLFRRLQPNARRIALVSDDSETSLGALKFIRSEKVDFEIVSCDTPSTFEGWQRAILGCQDSADAIGIYTYHTVKREGQTQSMPPGEVMEWTVAHSRIPILGFAIFTIDDGGLCGFLESAAEHGFRAAQMALELLSGKKAPDVPMVTALEGQSMLNLAAARRWGIAVPDEVRSAVDIVIGN